MRFVLHDSSSNLRSRSGQEEEVLSTLLNLKAQASHIKQR